MGRRAALIALATVTAVGLLGCGSGNKGAVVTRDTLSGSVTISKTHMAQQLTFSRIAVLKSGPECGNQQLIAGWTLLVRGHHPCAPSAHVQHVFRAYLDTPACLRRPAPSGTSCAATDGYRCVTWNWRDFPGIKTVVDCIARTGPRTATFFTAWSPQARQ